LYNEQASPAAAGDACLLLLYSLLCAEINMCYFFFFPLSWYMINAPMVITARVAPMSFNPAELNRYSEKKAHAK
jgi:hypothetical protein